MRANTRSDCRLRITNSRVGPVIFAGWFGSGCLCRLSEQRVPNGRAEHYRQQERCSYKQRMAMAIH